MKQWVWYLCLATAAQAQTGYLTYATGVDPSGITAADLNGDGWPDLVIANAGSDALTILLNDTAGGFTTLAPFSLGQTTSTLAADLNGDRKTDLVVITPNLGSPGVGLVVLLGNGDGTFQSPLPVSGCTEATGVQAADLNGDGIPDLALTCLIGNSFGVPTGAYLLILPGNGDGTFGAGQQFSLGPTPWAVLTIADFNQDGKPDVAVATEGTLTVFLNDGKADFKPVASNGEPWNYAPGIAAGDFNGDGRLDLAVSGQSAANLQLGMVAVLLGQGDGTFQAAPSLQTNGYGPLIAMDLNGDGHVDLAEGLSSLVFFAGRGDGTFETGFPFGGSGSTGSSLALADFTGSGVMGFAGANTLVMPGSVESIATAFGSNLAGGSLGGTTVSVTDSLGTTRAAQLDYVSPGQVNYLIPAGTAPGLASVGISAGGQVAATGQIQVIPVAPALFIVNSDNLAAANVLRVSQNGDRTFESIYQAGENGAITALPINLGAPTDSVYLSLYGTGIRNLSSPSAVSATINWEFSAPVTYAGQQGTYAGLDQVNLQLPKALASLAPGTIVVQLTVDGQPSNRVTLPIQ